MREYVLEAVEQPDVVLDLNKPISSTACLEFLLLRVNSLFFFQLHIMFWSTIWFKMLYISYTSYSLNENFARFSR